MDFHKALHTLHVELSKIDRAISTLESLISDSRAARDSRRGRKSMSAAERKLVSERMKRYWASRRRGGSPSQMSATS